LYERDIHNVDPVEIREELLNDQDLDLLTVCAPCQPFSSQNRSSPDDDERRRLILQAVRFAGVLEPVVIFFENVAGLARDAFSPLVQELKEGLRSHYLLDEPRKANAADYDVPQRRWRWIMLASKNGASAQFPCPTTPPGQRSTVRNAIGDLAPLRAGESDSEDMLHFARNHHAITLERLSHIPRDGGSRDSLPDHLVLDCHKDYDGHPDVYGRMRWDSVAPTLTTGCTDITKGRFGHPEENRAISLREAARLQTFPDDYEFAGSSRDIAAQIGNAVPVNFVNALAPTLRSMIRS
jgi:DNA (cytosine-5)-methyltransferase 1